VYLVKVKLGKNFYINVYGAYFVNLFTRELVENLFTRELVENLFTREPLYWRSLKRGFPHTSPEGKFPK